MRSTPLQPPTTGTLHFIGDPHVPVLSAGRQTRFHRDLRDGQVPKPLARVSLGDFSNENGSLVNDAAGDAQSVAWAQSLPDAATIPFYTAIGNHDCYVDNRSPAAAAEAFGQASLQQSLDFGSFKLLIVNPDTFDDGQAKSRILLSQAGLDWLDGELASAGKDCIICCHAPLKDTVLDPRVNGTTIFDSSLSLFFVGKSNGVGQAGSVDDSAIREILGNRPNAIAWVSAHTHVDPARATGLFTTTTVGARQIIAANVPVLFYTTPNADATDPIYSVYATYTGDKTLEFRLRNHTHHTWDGWNGQRVTTLTAT